MKLGIYIGGTPNRQIDCRNIIETGNPGIGGTEYEFVMLATFIGQNKNSFTDIDLTVFQSGKYMLHEDVHSINDVHQPHIQEEAEKHHIEILILDSRLPLNLIKNFNSSKIKLIIWCHCIGSLYRHLLFATWDAVKRVVFVSRGHYLNYIDNPIIRKSSFVFNAISVNDKIHYDRNKIPFSRRPHDVVFMGALDKSKGFHVLAKSWPKVLKKVPDARLHVIGSANLYGGNFKLGHLGIAEEKYEKTFEKFISTKDGELHPSIVLHGQLGKEKYNVMSNCRIGVPNPDGDTETFCICAVEMQLCGCKVVTNWSSGYLDTVPAPNILVKRPTALADAIATSLMENDFDCTKNLKNIKDQFSIESAALKWVSIIHSVYNDNKISETVIIPNKFRFRKLNSYLRKIFPFIPPLGLITDTLTRFSGVIKRKLIL